MKRYSVLAGLWLTLIVAIPGISQAAVAPGEHYFNCKNCHLAGFSVTAMAGNNICLRCHEEVGAFIPTLSNDPPPAVDGVTVARRSPADASNHFGHNTATGSTGRETSHIWGVADSWGAAGAQAPSRTNFAGFYGRYNISTGKVTCSRCHNPHGETVVDILNNSTGLPTADLKDNSIMLNADRANEDERNNTTGLPGADGQLDINIPDGIPDGDGIPDNPLANQQLLQRDGLNGNIPLTPEGVCRACHVPFDIPNGPAQNGILTHPIVADYAAFQAANPNYYRTPAEIAAIGTPSKVSLVKLQKTGTAGVGCTSCHAAHYVDSDSSTADGAELRANLSDSDGHLLRSDGPLRTGATRDGAAGTAQLRSNLCQGCHKYAIHGKGGNQQMIGCLDCHGGHSYNGGSANAYVIKDATPTVVPVRLDRAPAGISAMPVSFNPFPAAGSTRTKWADNVGSGSANGYCEKCHGDVNSGILGAIDPEHLPGGLNECTNCHKHADPIYSFANDQNAKTCGQCHGFPPYKNISGYRVTEGDAYDGGWADNKLDIAPSRIGYDQTAYFKNETQAAHKTHAGAHLPIKDDSIASGGGAGEFYFVGTLGIDNCKPCHGANSGTPAGGHRQFPLATYPNTFRDVIFASISTTGGLTPSYITAAATCSSVYCHSNGRPRSGDGPTRTIVTRTSPAWTGLGTNYAAGGFKSIFGQAQATRCSDCHGYSAATMTTRSNSAVHNKHLGGGSMAISYECDVCHAETADRATTSKLKVSANDGSKATTGGGRHVNGNIEVAYKASGSTLFTALAVNTTGTNWTVSTGTCSIYCHDPKDSGLTADWDLPASGACGTCHPYTSGTLTTGAHAIHINSSKADISCNACHGTGAITGTHAGHVDGVPTTLGASVCDACHGIDAGDSTPVWANPSSTSCSSCHSGATTTSYTKRGGGTVTAPVKALAATVGHNRPTASGVYQVTGKPAGNKQCSACHQSSISAGHVDGLGNGDLLIVSFSCEACHTAGGSRSAEATVRVKTHSNTDPTYTLQKRADFTKLCLACHDPHGTLNAAMLERSRTAQNAKDASGNYGGDVTFSAMTGADSFDEDDGTGNLDDVCATCHTTTLHNARAVAGTHQQGTNCTTVCHSHNSSVGGFMPSGGTACNDCHGNPPTLADNRPAGKAGVHAAHVNVAGHSESEDKFDCEVCHPGAASFTLGHSDGSVSLASGITNGACSSACHYSEAGVDGYWTDSNGLNCSSCHYWGNPPTSAGNTASVTNRENLTPTHNKHFDAGKVCTACHTDNSADTTYGVNGRVHIDNKDWLVNNTNDGTVLTARANAVQDNASVTVTTWVDGTNTCSNAACHNPSGITKSATWGTPNSQNCDFCHSSTNPDTGKGTPGSHGPHMAAATNFGINTIACTSCHPNNTGNNGHLNGSVSLNGFTYTTSLTDYTSSTFGRCTTTTCHNNGRGTAVQTPVWGTASADCSICHAAPPAMANNRHAEHVANTGYIANPNACGKCHLLASATQITATSHIDGTRNVGSQIVDMDLVTGGNQLVAPGGWNGTCVNNCHLVDTTGTWTDAAANKLTCLECHTSGKLAGGAYPNTGLHTGTLTVSQNTHDNSFKVTKNEVTPSGTCMTCHPGIDLANDLPATHYAGGAPVPAEATIPITVGYTGGPTPTCGPNGALVNCHDDKGIWKRRWSTTATATNGTQCGNCHGNFDLTWVTGISQRHSGDAQIHGGHTGGVNDCYICHTFGWGATYPDANDAKHRDGNIQLNNGMLFNDDGATVHCTGCHDNKPLGLADGQYSFQDTWNGDGADGGLNRWGRVEQAGPPANCNGCHALTNGLDHDGTNESLAVHDYHTGSPLTSGCGACHPADSGPGGALHQNNQLDFGGTYLSLTAYPVTPGVGGNFTNTNCSTANGCHNSDNNSWVSDSLATCGDCHAATGKSLYIGSGLSGYPPTSNEHGIHIDNNAYVGGTPTTDCDDCHGTGASAPGHLARHNDGALDVIAAVATGSKITQLNPDKSCTNTCHITASGRDWDSGTSLVCNDCHNNSASYIGGGANMPATGLHAGTLTVSQNTHDDLFKNTKAEGAPGTATCVTCHTATPSTAHANGVFNSSPTSIAAIINFAAAVNFTDSATAPTCGPNGALINCHDDDGIWKRKWSTTAKNNDGTQCANCHGDFTAGFTTGVVARHQTTTSGDADGQVASSHDGTDKCYTCHNYKAGSTTYYDFAVKHRDNNLQVNSNASFVDNGTTVGCSGCHVANDGTADEQHSFAEASGVRFARALEAGPQAGCNSCHGGDYAPAGNLNYWPGAAGASAPDRAGEHNAHMIKLVARLGFNMAALTDGQQKQMCAYCHPYSVSIGEGGHGDAAPSEVGSFDRIMDGLPDSGTVGSYTPGNGTGGSCAAVDCHNNKTTPATHEWYDGATSACIMCHLDVTADTTHVAHTGSSGTFGKVITCANCHEAATNWSTNTPPASNHINGAFTATAYTGFTYPSAKGSCGINTCHNNGKNAATPAYTWGTPIVGCAACHATDATLGSSHTPHMNATFTSTFRPTAAGCAECHDAVSAVSMAGKTAHMDGAVTLAAGFTYTGTPNSLNVTLGTYGSCTGSCHTNGKGAAPATAAVWNTAYANCTICHALPNSAGNDGARHTKHVANTTKLPASCGECHLSATTTTYSSANHLNATVNTGNKISAHTNGTATCTNSCHVVNITRGDWLDTNPLGCTDCHQSGSYLASTALPTSGLHAGTLTVSQNTHDDLFKNTKAEGAPGTATCVTCHTATPSTAHINGTFTTSWNAAPPSINFAATVGFTDAATPTCGPNGALINCHDDDGVWKRKWSITAKNSDGTQCANCHGDFTAGFTTGVVARHQTTTSGDADGQVASNHDGTDKCYTCHNYKAGSTTYYDFAVKHRDGSIQINDGSFVDNGTTVGCSACHSANDGTADEQHAFAEASGVRFTRSLEPGVSAGCNTCHGVGGAGGNWPIKATDDAGTADDMNQDGQHSIHVYEIAKKLYATSSPSISQRNNTCNYCHPGNGHGGANGVLPADVSRTETTGDNTPDSELGTTMKKLIGGGNDNNGLWRRTPATCSNVACHASAPYTPHWYADTTAPANVTLTAALGPVPRSIKLTWTAPGDDANLDGTAYKYDIRMGSGVGGDTVATNFGLITNYVQGVPTVKRAGSAQEAIIHNVSPSTTYYFALRTHDLAGNYGGTANGGGYAQYTTPVAATLDSVAPVLTGSPAWYGIDTAKVLDTSGAVKLSWTRAEDHSMPITYDLWWSTGAITYGAPQVSTKDTSYRVTGLTDGQTYNFAVRAKDAYNNSDTNTVTMQAIPQGLGTVPKSGKVYYANGTATSNIPMQLATHTTNGTTTSYPVVFIGPETFSSNTTIFANSFSVYIDNGSSPSEFSAELGYITGASTWNSFSTPLFATNQTVAKRAIRTVTFKFNGAQRVMTGSWNAKLGVRVSRVSATTVDFIGWGPTSKGGILAVDAQPINASPAPAPAVSTSVSGANVSIWWAASGDSTDGVADTVHYDVYGSANGGADGFPHVIATGLSTNATSGTPLVWDTQAAGIALTGAVSNVQVRVEAGDVINGKILSHTPATSGNINVNNSGDNVAPGTITSFKAETRPKQGSVYLTWTSPGDDGTNNGRAASYDIRYATTVIDNDTKYNTATQLVSEPYPDFGGNGQGYEIVGLASGNYFFAIKAVDEGNKTSPLAYTAAAEPAGPKCGICHSTPPDESASKGNHAKHGYTMKDCANCHGTAAATFTTDHQNGEVRLGWKTASPVLGVIDGTNRITYTQGAVEIYTDAKGGGFNAVPGDELTEVDNGTCSGWSSLQVSGCHGSAASVSWADTATLACNACHGDNSRTLDKWGHSFDDSSADVKASPPVDNHGYSPLTTEPVEGKRSFVGAHVAHLNYSFRLSKGDSCRLCHGASRPGSSLHADGNIDVKLDLAAAGPSATWTDGNLDPDINLRTAGSCASMSPDSCHPAAGGPIPLPKWDAAQTFDCVMCHGFGGTTPGHVTDPNKLIIDESDSDSTPQMPGNCTWCHVGGHPKEKKVTAITKASPAVVTTENDHHLTTGNKVTIHTQVGMTEINNKTFTVTVTGAKTFQLQGSNSSTYTTFTFGTWIEGNGFGIILIPNDSRAGINYGSGGIHLKANIGARGEMSSEAELCWSCHVPNNISEWGADNGPTNIYTRAGFTNNNYNYGTLSTQATTGNWIGATWTSANFAYKTQTIRSTHSTDANGTAALTGSAYNYSENVDTVSKIHCSNCHDVHDSSNSPLEGDSLNPDGAPYLRGTWKSNPYKEDGAPQSGTNYTAATSGNPGYGYGPVPRANPSTSQQMGGYWIDQNSDSPTAGWTYDSSAALCKLCHNANVDQLDQVAGENLWLSTNGHANSTLGGSGAGAANIFKNGITSNVGRQGTGGGNVNPNPGVWMGFQIEYTDSDDYGYGPRSDRVPHLTPTIGGDWKISTLLFAWGNAVDAGTTEIGYHQFSCSKCHNPHASRLPKLLITNCLDVALNTWDNSYKSDTDWSGKNFNTTTSSWGRNRISHLSTAQNCHRFIDINNDNTPDESGWNKVTPWGTNNP